MKTHSRLCRVTLLFFSHSILILTLTAIVAAQTPNPIDGCDATLKAKLKFKELRTQFIKDRTSVDKSEFRRAARNYIRLAEQCYELTVGESAVGQRIDEGGLWMGPSGASVTESPFSEDFVLFGTKWGAGSPFAGGTDVPGPRLPGGLVTYSFMADGVDLAADTGAVGDNVAITSLGTFAPCFLDEIELAFGAWSAVADILFVPVADGGGPFNVEPIADIRIGAHVFTGPPSTLAHGFFPPPNGATAAGDVHFDTAEPWTCAPAAGSIGLGLVALHEVGHAIGLDHEDTEIAVMNAFYNAALTFGPLADDLIGAGEIYGEAGAAGTSFFGPVGIGTSSPGTDLHVFGSATEDIYGGFGVDPRFPGDCALNFGYGGGTFGAGVGFMNVRECAQNPNNVRLQFNVKGAEKLRLTTAGATFTGNVGIGTSNPTNILVVAAASGTGFVDSSGNFVDGSSREFKDEIRDLDLQSAQEVLRELEPVRYFGKNSHEDEHLGFIAEDVPYLVAQTGRKGLRAMDIVAVLTKVVQEQQENIEVLKARIDITGNLTMSGNCADAPGGGGCTPDYIFEPGYDLESIEEHAAVMWENRHLPAVGKGDDTLNVVKTTWGMLEELEKAHIYIERLHEQAKEKDKRIRELERRLNDRDAVFSRRLSRLETLLGAVPAD